MRMVSRKEIEFCPFLAVIRKGVTSTDQGLLFPTRLQTAQELLLTTGKHRIRTHYLISLMVSLFINALEAQAYLEINMDTPMWTLIKPQA
jgi:hypothetical protein